MPDHDAKQQMWRRAKLRAPCATACGNEVMTVCLLVKACAGQQQFAQARKCMVSVTHRHASAICGHSQAWRGKVWSLTSTQDRYLSLSCAHKTDIFGSGDTAASLPVKLDGADPTLPGPWLWIFCRSCGTSRSCTTTTTATAIARVTTAVSQAGHACVGSALMRTSDSTTATEAPYSSGSDLIATLNGLLACTSHITVLHLFLQNHEHTCVHEYAGQLLATCVFIDML